jgi:chemotaxis protein MotB
VDQTPEIVFLRKRARHKEPPHSGAWKVAYADFVTAMMALFIVLWLLSSSKEVQVAVGGYFRDPKGYGKLVGTNNNGSADYVALKKQDLEKLKEQLIESIHHVDPMDKLKGQIEITITSEGLRIELMEAENGTFFELGSAEPTKTLKDLLKVLAEQLGKLPNKVSIEGHTDSRPYVGTLNYDNWDLSTDRANEARRLMQSAGLATGQLSQVRGFADQQLRLPNKPTDPSNRRISLIVQRLIMEGAEAPLPANLAVSSAPESAR